MLVVSGKGDSDVFHQEAQFWIEVCDSGAVCNFRSILGSFKARSSLTFSLLFQWQRDMLPSMKYLIYRWIFASYFVFVLALSLVSAAECNQIDWYPIYLTNWNVVMNVASSILTAILVTRFYRNHHNFTDSQIMPLAFKVSWVLTNLSTAASITLSCVYWPFIYTGRDTDLNNALVHGGNAIVLFIDLFINAYPPSYGHFVYPMTLGIFYAYIFSTIYTFSGGTNVDSLNYIYTVLDWTNHTKKAFIFASLTLLFLIFVHFIVTSVVHLRIYVKKRCASKSNDPPSSSIRGTDNLSFDLV
jgi:membrane protein implicated in regulation of membrane protease activity